MPKVWLIGDLIADYFHYGEIERLAQEAPIPILKEERVEIKPGGAGNVAMSLALMGLDTYFLTDQHGSCASSIGSGFKSVGVKFPLPSIVRDVGSVKHRFVAQNQGQLKYVFRKDEESAGKRTGSFDLAWLDEVKKESGLPELLVVCDYGKGLLTSDKIRLIIEWGLKANIPTIVDAHPWNIRWMDFWAASLVKMNRHEWDLEEKFVSQVNIDEEMPYVCGENNICRMVVTNDREGAYFGDENGVRHYPTEPREVADVCGAGDVALASLVYSYFREHTEEVMVRSMNSVAGWAVQQFGTAVLSEGIMKGILNEGGPVVIRSEQRVLELLETRRKYKQRVVFTNGCFDLVHPGHIYLLQEAKKLGSVLVVAINSDESVRRLKGEGRPILNEQQRAFALAALDCVTYVVIQNDDTPHHLLRKFKPDVLAKGSSSQLPPVGSEIVSDYGGSVEVIPVQDDLSTSKIVEKITNGA